MPLLLEIAAGIVFSKAATSPMTPDELAGQLQKVYSALKALETEEAPVAPFRRASLKRSGPSCPMSL